jgi:cell wall-associated NlpC family hydrolase
MKPPMMRVALFSLGLPFLGACTLVGGVESPPAAPVPVESERPAPGGAASGDTERITATVIEIALDAIGTPYEWGGTDANGFDCSGLIQFAYGRVGISLPRVSTAQVRAGTPVALNPDLFRPGDILGFSTTDPGRTSHVGLYVGDGEFIHSSSSGVRISNMQNPYWQDHIVAARRIVD